MTEFIQQYGEKVTGVLSGFDRLVLRGRLRMLSFSEGMMGFLASAGVLLKNFGEYVEGVTEEVKAASRAEADRLGRPVRYLQSSRIAKAPIAEKIAMDDGITEGLICVLSCVEPCMSYQIHRNGETKMLELVLRQGKCLHLYHYWIDRVFGFMSARVQTWFPFSIQVCVNGREWLGRQMDKRGIRYERRENCFTQIEDVKAAQGLMNRQLKVSWSRVLAGVAKRANPAYRKILGVYQTGYYWTAHQSEWATDIMFRSASELSAIYGPLVRGGISVFSSADVMRFLGKKLDGRFRGEVVSSYRKRPEGIRIKHQVRGNSVKAYDKQGTLLRVETTINEPREFKVYRPKEGEPDGARDWRPMRKGIADLHRRAMVSQQSNKRYLQALASLNTDMPAGKLVEPTTERVSWKGRPVRGLRPWTAEDRALLEVISRGEFAVNGLRNRDVVRHLHGGAFRSPEERTRAAARVTRKLRMLRAHGIIKKVTRTHRYVLTESGREAASAILKLHTISMTQLNEIAA